MKSATPSTATSSKGKSQPYFVGNKRTHEALKAHEQELLNDLRQAHLQGKRKRAAYLQRQYLNSFAARYVATKTAYETMKKGQRPPKASLFEFAEGLDAFRGTDEIVEVYWKPKKSNPHEFRPIMKFGIRNRALQYLAAACLKAQANFHPMQFAINCGRQAAVKQTIQFMQNGYDYVSEMDIADCFPSFDGEKLSQVLPLPKEVIEHVVLSTHFNMYPIDTFFQSWGSLEDLYDLYSEELTEARRGIAQGSATSSVVAEILLSPVLAPLPNYGTALTYADNILLLTQSNKEAVAMRKALRCVLHEHPAGPLTLNKPKTYKPGEAIDFLGYRLSVDKDEYRVEPTPENLLKFMSRFEHELKKVSAKHISPELQETRGKKLKAYVAGWSSAFGLWDEAKQHRDKHIAKINMATFHN